MNQPRFNTHNPTQIESDYLAAMSNPDLAHLMNPDQVANLLGVSRLAIMSQVRGKLFPPPDVVIGTGPSAVRRWFPFTVFDFLKNGMPKKDAAA